MIDFTGLYLLFVGTACANSFDEQPEIVFKRLLSQPYLLR
jgi:hypothetical protein